jgi:hypothetical protein
MEKTAVSVELCEIKHSQIVDRVKCLEDTTATLVKSDAVNTTNVKLLLKAVWGLFGTVLALLGGFLVWYIQQI